MFGDKLAAFHLGVIETEPLTDEQRARRYPNCRHGTFDGESRRRATRFSLHMHPGEDKILAAGTAALDLRQDVYPLAGDEGRTLVPRACGEAGSKLIGASSSVLALNCDELSIAIESTPYVRISPPEARRIFEPPH